MANYPWFVAVGVPAPSASPSFGSRRSFPAIVRSSRGPFSARGTDQHDGSAVGSNRGAQSRASPSSQIGETLSWSAGLPAAGHEPKPLFRSTRRLARDAVRRAPPLRM